MADSEIPEFYVDQYRCTLSGFGAAMTLGLTPAHPDTGKPQPSQDLVRVRMSLEHAKVMAMILRRQLKAFEEQTGAVINIPRQIYNSVGLSPEDWV